MVTVEAQQRRVLDAVERERRERRAQELRARAAGRAGQSKAGTSAVARLPEVTARAGWRWRWQLAPFAGSAGVLACGHAAPGVTALALAVGSRVVGWWAGRDGTVFGRQLLAGSERRQLALWGACGALWAAGTSAVAISAGADTLMGAAVLAVPAVHLARARLPRRARLSSQARAMIDAWVGIVVVHGPDPVKGSRPVLTSATEPGPGAVTFLAELADHVHGRDAAAAGVRQQVEALLRLPVDTVVLAAVRDSSNMLRVTLTPLRHLEARPVGWPGPVLDADGWIPNAERPDGSVVRAVRLFNESGIEHGYISGTSDVGKSSTSATVLLPGPTTRLETVWYLDGKRGTSAPYLKAASDWYLLTPAGWAWVIEAAYAVMVARQVRRGKAGLSRWVMAQEVDPILTLFVDEATTVAENVSPRHHAMVLAILREGRALGVRVVEVFQDPMADGILGGRKARELMAGNGFVIAHRPGGGQSNRLTVESTSVKLDLTGLPAEPGFAAYLRKGQLVAFPARNQFASEDAARDAAARVVVRPLVGADLEAAGPRYAERHAVDPWAEPDGQTVDDAGTAEQQAASDQTLLDILRDGAGPLTLKQIEDHPRWTFARRTVSRSLLRLSAAEVVTKEGAAWALLVNQEKP